MAEFLFRSNVTWLAVTLDFTTIEIYDLETHKTLGSLNGECKAIENLISSPDGELLAAVCPKDEKVVIWDLDVFEKIYELPLPGYTSSPPSFSIPITGGNFSNGNGLLAIFGCRIPSLNYQGLEVGCLSSGVIVFSLENGKIYQELEGVQKSTFDVRFNFDGSVLVLVGEGEPLMEADLFVWNVGKKQRTTIVRVESENGLMEGQFFPYDDYFVTSSANGELLFIDLTSWEIIKKSKPNPNVELGNWMISEASPILVTDTNSGIDIRDPNNEEIYHTLSLQVGIIYKLAISPDARSIYTMSEDGFVRKWGIVLVGEN